MSLGKVYLVGAGPGDPGLLTLTGLECLKRADLVLYDGLANPLLLRHTRAQAERTCRSETPSGRMLDQEEINRRLIEAAQAGKTVVRLKGGDPFIFGRGGEEALALAKAGVPFEVVPGVTAATAASEYAGISLTHRRHASAVAFVTGHEGSDKTSSAINYELLARFRGTLVFYMGLHRLEDIANSLLGAGLNPDVPACVISRATTPEQRTITAPLKGLPAAVKKAELHAPSLIVIGECVRQRDQIAWFEQRPLFGKRIGITRPDGQADAQIEHALQLGAQPVLLPTIEIRPPQDWSEVDKTLEELPSYDWLVFTSVNGVNSLLGRLWETGGDLRRLSTLKLAAIGPATAKAIESFHLRADVVPEEYRAEMLAEQLVPHVSGKKVLWARASRGRDVLPAQLGNAGAEVQELVVYQNLDVAALPQAAVEQLEAGEVDWIGLSSPSIARSLKELLTPAALQHVGGKIRLASISPVTSEAAREAGLPIAAEAQTYTWSGILDAIVAAESDE